MLEQWSQQDPSSLTPEKIALTSTGEYLERDKKAPYILKIQEKTKDRSLELLLPNENGLPMARGSKGSVVRRGL